MKNNTLEKKSASHYKWAENWNSWLLVDKEEFSVKHEIMPGGSREEIHYHKYAQHFYFILEGIASFYLNDKYETIRCREGLLIKPKTSHFIANETLEDLEFLLFSLPTTNNDHFSYFLNEHKVLRN